MDEVFSIFTFYAEDKACNACNARKNCEYD